MLELSFECWKMCWCIFFFSFRTATVRLLEEGCQSITPMSSKCFSSATARESPLLQQWVAAPLMFSDSSPSTSKGMYVFSTYNCLGNFSRESHCWPVNWCRFLVPTAAAVRCHQPFASGPRSWTIQDSYAVCSRQRAFHWLLWLSPTLSSFKKLKLCQPKLR